MNLLAELRRRNVLRVGSAYVVSAWLVAQVAEFVTETFASPLWVLQSVVGVLGVALVPVLVFTWMFEFTPQGFRRQTELDRAGVVSARSGRRLDFLIAVLMLVAAAWVAWSWSERMRARESDQQAAHATPATPAADAAAAPPANSVAVLPFLDLSKAGDSEVLADGLAEELLGVLGRNRELRVTARSSAFQFKGQNRDLRDVGRALGVRYLLEGSVRLAGARVRIGTQLVDATNGIQLWSESYDRTLSDLFALQEEIGAEVAKALQVVVTATSSTPAASGTRSVEAHMELLRALQVGASRAVVDLDRAIGHLQRALVLDPDYAAACVELAYAMHTRALQLGEEDEVLDEIAPLLGKALALDPDNGAAVLMRGALLVDDPVQAEREMREGLRLAPSHARGYEIMAGRLSQDAARVGEALAMLDQAIALDPLSPRNHQMKGILGWQSSGDLASAEPHFLRAFELEPRFRMALVHLSTINMSRGDFARAVEFGERVLAVDPAPAFRAGLVHHYLNIGDPQAAERAQAPDALGSALEILLYRGEIARASALLAATPPERLPLGGVSPVVAVALRDASARGAWAENLERVRAFLGYAGSLPEELPAFGFNHAQLAALMRGAGADADADALDRALLERIERDAAQSPAWMQGPFDFSRAMLHAGAGRREAALDALERAFRPARPYWWCLLDGNPVFDGIRTEPRYRALRERLDAHLAGQRALLARMRDAGDPGVAE